jgi:hypothetical protein
MYVNPRKTTSVKYLGQIDVCSVRDDILAIPEVLWDFENSTKPNRFETLDRTRHIVFRFIHDLGDWRNSYDRPLWSAWRSRLEPLLLKAVEPYGYRNGVFPRVMLARMAVGGVIRPHTDNMPAAKWPHKIHIPITTNDQVLFYIEPETHHFPVGQAVEVNNMVPHAVKNEGATDRIHLIFEYYDRDQPSWLDAKSAG